MTTYAARLRAGGPTSLHRDALSLAGLAVLRELVFARENWRCGWCCSFAPLQLEHAVERSAGGADTWSNTWGVCPNGHLLKTASYTTGRLLVEPLGDGRFHIEFVRGTKRVHHVVFERVIGRAPTAEEQTVLDQLVAA